MPSGTKRQRSQYIPLEKAVVPEAKRPHSEETAFSVPGTPAGSVATVRVQSPEFIPTPVKTLEEKEAIVDFAHRAALICEFGTDEQIKKELNLAKKRFSDPAYLHGFQSVTLWYAVKFGFVRAASKLLESDLNLSKLNFEVRDKDEKTMLYFIAEQHGDKFLFLFEALLSLGAQINVCDVDYVPLIAALYRNPYASGCVEAFCKHLYLHNPSIDYDLIKACPDALRIVLKMRGGIDKLIAQHQKCASVLSPSDPELGKIALAAAKVQLPPPPILAPSI